MNLLVNLTEMKFRILLLLLFFHFLYSCIGIDNKYALEDEIYKCYKTELLEKNIQIDIEIAEIEKMLIKNEILKNNSGRSFSELLISLLNEEFKYEDLSDEVKQNIENLKKIPLSVICRSQDFKINEVEYKDSKFSEFIKILNSFYLGMNIKSESYLDVFNDEDFEHPFYKTTIINVLVNYQR